MLHFTVILTRLGHALLLGGLIGFEREQRDRPAGLRTHMIVSLASAAFMIISLESFNLSDFSPETQPLLRFDPSRIASYVVAGIGFLGAGTIMRAGGNIVGLTTAASIWLVSAMGLASGAGLYQTAWLTGVLGLATLHGVRFLEQALDQYRLHPERRWLELTLPPTTRDAVHAHLDRRGIRVEHEDLALDNTSGVLALGLLIRAGSQCELPELVHELAALPGVTRVTLGTTPEHGPGGG